MANQQFAQGQNVGQQEWQSGLCDCSPCDSCLLGTFLPCILLGQTSDRMRDPTMRTAETFNSDCVIYCGIQCLTGCGWIYAMVKRREIRERFGIKGGGFGDCCTTYWCHCCALIQQDNEVKARLAQGPVTQGYVANKEGMHVPMPGQQQQQVNSPMQSPPVSHQETGHQEKQQQQQQQPQQNIPLYDPHQPPQEFQQGQQPQQKF